MTTMKLSDIKSALKAEVIVGEDKLDMPVSAGTGSDLMSDMLTGPTSGSVLLTGLNNIQVVRTSVIAGVAAVVLVRGKRPTAEMKEHAAEEGLPMLSTPYTMYSACGRLFREGLLGVERRISKASAEKRA